MSRELLILRHGKSDWSTGADDFHRPLLDRGKRDAQKMAVWLQQQQLLPDHILSSPAERALVTAEKTCKAMGRNARTIVTDQRIYAASLDDLLAVLRDCPRKRRRILLVGHNPGLESLLLYLAGNSEELLLHPRILPTAALARLTLPDDWKYLASNSGHLHGIIRPRDLPDGFPFPDPDSEERRERPAYYYTQSSVIPYRRRKGRIEILVIRSSKAKHWVIPKGIREPGLSLRQSAAKEALEEAGVRGKVGPYPIGSYRYPKWGASCEVHVYPMEVKKVLSKKQWQEKHRGRKWLSPEQAAQRVKQQQLAPMIRILGESLAEH